MLIRLLHPRRLPPPARRPGLIRKAVRTALGGKAHAQGEINVVFVSDEEIRTINKTHLRHDCATDVIAFPNDGSRSPGAPPAEFGEIVISVDTARRQAAELGHPVLREVVTLAAHGALHLIGYDDRGAGDKLRMFRRQDAVVKAVLG